MSTAAVPGLSESAEVERQQARLPPVVRLATATLALVVAGGIDTAAHYGRPTSLAVPVGLAVAGAAVLIVNVAWLSRVKEFAWQNFFMVFKWALLAYVVIAGLLEYVFVFDHTTAKPLALFTVMLALFAMDVPLLLAFSVARYQPVSATPARTDG